MLLGVVVRKDSEPLCIWELSSFTYWRVLEVRNKRRVSVVLLDIKQCELLHSPGLSAGISSTYCSYKSSERKGHLASCLVRFRAKREKGALSELCEWVEERKLSGQMFDGILWRKMSASPHVILWFQTQGQGFWPRRGHRHPCRLASYQNATYDKNCYWLT